jgi:hypothetical protein
MLRGIVVVAIATLFAFVLLAGTPDISGTWKINMQKSDFGSGNPPPDDLTFKVRMGEGALFHVTQLAGGTTLEFRFSTDGKEQVNDTGGGTMTSTHRWEGDVLVGDYKVKRPDGSEIPQKDRITCSADGKSMIISRQFTDFSLKYVLDRQ